MGDNDRDCANCVHYIYNSEKDYHACESWQCYFEPREDKPDFDCALKD